MIAVHFLVAGRPFWSPLGHQLIKKNLKAASMIFLKTRDGILGLTSRIWGSSVVLCWRCWWRMGSWRRFNPDFICWAVHAKRWVGRIQVDLFQSLVTKSQYDCFLFCICDQVDGSIPLFYSEMTQNWRLPASSLRANVELRTAFERWLAIMDAWLPKSTGQIYPKWPFNQFHLVSCWDYAHFLEILGLEQEFASIRSPWLLGEEVLSSKVNPTVYRSQLRSLHHFELVLPTLGPILVYMSVCLSVFLNICLSVI